MNPPQKLPRTAHAVAPVPEWRHRERAAWSPRAGRTGKKVECSWLGLGDSQWSVCWVCVGRDHLALASMSTNENNSNGNSNSIVVNNNRSANDTSPNTNNFNSIRPTQIQSADSAHDELRFRKRRTGTFQFGDIWYADDGSICARKKRVLVM